MKFLAIIFALVVADQATKNWARTNLEAPMELWDGISLRFAENTGIAFSLPLNYWLIIGLSVVVIAFLGWSLFQQKYPALTKIAFVLLLAGAMGNLIDRVFLGAVTDFISVYSFPIFNLADSFISIGVVLYLWQEIIG